MLREMGKEVTGPGSSFLSNDGGLFSTCLEDDTGPGLVVGVGVVFTNCGNSGLTGVSWDVRS